MNIQLTTVDDLKSSPEFMTILAGYAIEASLDDMPFPNPDLSHYSTLESAGRLKVLAAYEDQTLIGFLCLLTAVLPHYNATVSHVESFYVATEHRKSGAAVALLRGAETLARSLGAVGMSVSAAIGSRMEIFMDHQESFRETHRAFFKGFHNA